MYLQIIYDRIHIQIHAASAAADHGHTLWGNFLTLSAVYNTKDRGRIYLIELAPNNDHDTLRTLYEIYDALRLGLDKRPV